MGFPFVVTMMTYQYQWIMLEYGKADSIRSYFWISSVLEVRTSESRGFVFRPRVNLIHNQTLRRPSRGKERSDSARPDYKPSKTLFLRCFECQRIDLLEATLGQASIRNITVELLARF